MRLLLFSLFIASLVIADQTCSTGETYVKFTKKCGSNYASEESFEIYGAGVLVYTSPTFANSETRVIEHCLTATTNNQYQVILKDSYGDSWSSGAWLMIEGPYGNRVFKNMLTDSLQETYTLSLYTPIKKADEWKLSGAVTGNWYDYSFSDSMWSSVTLGSVTATITGPQYFRKTFTGLAGMAAYEFSLNYRYGIVAYMNGAEIYRDNMPVGTPSSSTLATGSYSVIDYHSFIRPGGEVANTQSILAVELHFLTTEGQSTVDFDSYLALYASSVTGDELCYIYAYDTTLTVSGGTNIANMFDYSRSTYYYASSSYVPATVSYSFDGPTPFLNGIRVWPYTSPTTAPSSFSLQGASSVATSWTNILVESGIIHTSNTYTISHGYFNTGLYSNYQLILSGSSTTYIYAYEVQPVVCSVTLPTSIEFSQASYSFYARYEEVTVKPVINEFVDCTISPTLVEGLEFDSATCTLTGIVDSVMTTTYTVTSIMNEQTYTGTFTLQIVTCSGVVGNVIRTYKSNAAYEAFTIRDASSNVILQVTTNGGQINNVETKHILCLTSNQYTLSLSSSSNYWVYNSLLYMNVMLDGSDDYETVLRVRYDNYQSLPTSYTFNVNYGIKPLETWNYIMGSVPDNWYSSTSGWSSASAGSFPASTNQIQLYKKTFSVSSLDGVAGFVISLKYRYGVLIYVNNHEVFRKGFTGDVSTSSYSSTSLGDANFRQISLPVKTMTNDTATPSVDYLTTGTNTIAIALVAAGVAQTEATFDCALRLMGAESTSRIGDASYTSSGFSGSPSYLSYKYYSYTVYQSTCSTNYYYFTFNDDRHEWISSITIKLHYTQVDQQPRQFTVLAKNAEDSTWTTLKTVTGLAWSLQGQENRIWITNSKAYNQYRIENVATGSTTECYWKMSYFDLKSDATNVEVPTLSYDSSISIYKDIEMAEVYPNSSYYTDFTITPALPTGVNLDPNTGVISGTASATQSALTYTVSAKKYNTGETVTASFSLTVDVCYDNRSLITLVVRSDSTPANGSWKVYQGKDTTGTVMYSVDQLPVISALSYGDFCLNHGIYTLELKSTSTGWTMPAGYYLSVDIGEMKFEMGQVYKSSSPALVTKQFSSYLPFQIEYDDWKVYKETAVADGWNAIDFDDSTWTVTKAADIGTTEAIAVYIRRDITLDDVSNYQVLNVRVKYAGGVVCYFNGRKVARFNLEDSFDADTESIEVHDSTVFSKFHIVLPTVGAVTGKNVIAFEIHRPLGQSSSEAVVFDATGVFGVNDCSIGVDSVIDVSGTTGTTIGDLTNFFDLTPVTYGYQSNSVGTYLQWTVENLEGTKFNSFAMETPYSRTSWGFSLYGRDDAYEDDDPQAEEYVSMFAELSLATVARGRSAWDVPVGIGGFRQFKWEVDDTASSSVYISAYIFQYCKASGDGYCEAVGDYPAVAEGQISPADCESGFRGYSYRTCTNGVLGEIQTDKCVYKIPARMRYNQERYTLVLNTQTSVDSPRYQNIITQFYLADGVFLPNGLTLDETTGAITGTPTEEVSLKTYTIYGENPSGVTYTTINLSVRKGECKADGNFQKTQVGEVAEYECSLGGSYVGTQKRACILGAKDGEWQKIQGTCMPISMIVILAIIVIVVLCIVAFFIMRITRKNKAVGGVKGKKNTKNMKSTKAAPKKSTKSSPKSVKI